MATATQDVTIWDETNAGSAVHLDAAALPGTRAVVVMGGSDGTNLRAVSVNSSGQLVLASTSTVGANLRDGSGNAIDSRLYDSTNNTIFSNHRGLDVVERRMPLVAAGNNAVASDAGWWAGDTTVATVSKTNLVSIALTANQAFFVLHWSINRATQASTVGTVKTLEIFDGTTTTLKAKACTNAAAATDLWEVTLPRAVQLNPKQASPTYSIRLTVTDTAATSTIWSYRIIGVII